ncbi:MAG TPA: hypothetical protein VMQ63_07635 [Stellaceae bacterium]|jgi:hypothetical protein|nr:hypothetical protein [Stellaceae bacterium]
MIGMIRLGTVLWIVVIAAVGYAMFQVKFEVTRLDQHLGDINRDIAASREATRVLNAEWSLLSDPQRLDRLNQSYLHLTPVTGAQIGRIDQIPLRAQAVAQNPQLASAPMPSKGAP